MQVKKQQLEPDREQLVPKQQFGNKEQIKTMVSIGSVQSLSRVQLFAIPWIAACQASLSITISRTSLVNFCAEYIMRNAGLEEAQAVIKIVGRNINNLRYADDTTLMAESEEELKSLLIKVKEESEKFGLNLNIQKTKIMAPGPITSWEIDGETVETVSDFIFWAPKSLQMVTAAMKLKDAYSLEGKLWAT